MTQALIDGRRRAKIRNVYATRAMRRAVGLCLFCGAPRESGDLTTCYYHRVMRAKSLGRTLPGPRLAPAYYDPSRDEVV